MRHLEDQRLAAGFAEIALLDQLVGIAPVEEIFALAVLAAGWYLMSEPTGPCTGSSVSDSACAAAGKIRAVTKESASKAARTFTFIAYSSAKLLNVS